MDDSIAWMESRSFWLVRLLWVMIAVDLVAIGSGIMEYSLLQEIASGDYGADLDARADANDLRQQIIGLTQFGLFVVAGILSLMWIRRANVNARAAGISDMQFTPNWSIGWYFVPIANLWKPYQAMTEIWRASALGSALPADAPRLFPVWWTIWLVSSVLDRVTFQFARRAETIDQLIDLNRIFLVADVATIALNLAFMAVIKEICQRQVAMMSVEQTFA